MTFYKILPLVFLLAACAGRAEREITASRGYDDNLPCEDIIEFHKINENLVDQKLMERKKTLQRNAIVGVAASFVFTPLLLATDMRDIEKNEILSLKRRNETLREMAKTKECEMPQVRHQELYNILMR
jgi:hypothetical protein